MAKKKKKKLKPGESYTRKNRPKGVSKREWDKARKAEGLDPRAKFFADPEPARQRARKAKLSAQEKKQADKFVAEYQKQSQQQTQQHLGEFEETQSGWKGALNRFLGMGVSKPTLANETPEYTQQRIESEPKSFGQNLKGIGNVLVEGEQQLGEGFGKILNLGDIAETQQKQVESNVNVISQWNKKLKETDDEGRKSKIKGIMEDLMKKNQDIVSNIKTDLTPEEKRKLAAGVIETGIDIGTAGLGSLVKGAIKTVAKKGVKEVAKKVVKKGFVQTAKRVIQKPITEAGIVGAVYGSTGLAFQDGEHTTKEYVKSSLIGAGIGIAGVAILSKIFSKLTTKKASKLATAVKEEKITQKEVEKIYKEKGIKGLDKKADELVPEAPTRAVEPVKPKVEVKTPIKEKVAKTAEKDPLTKEASKYKSADEFIKSQPKLYHGGTANIKEINTGKSNFSKTFYLTDDAKYAKSFGGNKSVVNEIVVSPNAKIIDLRKPNEQQISRITDAINSKLAKNVPYKKGISFHPFSSEQVIQGIKDGKAHFIELPEVKKIIKELGYDGMTTSEVPWAKNIGIWNKDVLKTKSQLTDIYNKAKVKPLTKPPVKPQSVPVKKGITVESMMADEVKATKARELAHKANVEEFIQPKVSDKRPKLDTYAAKKEYSDSLWSKTRTALQDSWVKAKNIERTKGVVKGKGVSPYEAETLFHGRIGARLENLVRTTEKFDRNVIATSKKLDNPNFSKQVDEYAQALHAPERNAVHGEGAAGMTNAQAKKVMAKVETSGNAKAIKQASTELIERNKETLKNLYEGQLINKETFDRLTKIYKNHVPLNRVMDEGDDIVSIMTGGKGFNIEGSGLKRAKGSEREVSDIMTNVHANLAEAITRSEKNKVGLSTLEFARNNKKLGFFEEIKPKAIGETFDGKPILQKVNDPNVLKVMEKGKPVYLKIHDPSLAAMYQGIGKDVLPDMFRPVEAITRYYSSMATRFNPEFGLSNKIRDLQEVIVNIFAMKKGGAKGVGNVLKNEAKSWKHVTDWMMGKDSEGARLYEQMRLDGGTTGGMSLSTRKKLDIDIAKIQKINRSNPRRGMEMLFNGLENWNTVIEDSTRLSVYKAGLTNGATREQAAIMAKNASLNFNKKGTAGSVVNALWMFSNASIQGTTNILRSFKNPKVAGTVATMVGSATYAINKWNDSINLDWREEFSEWDQNSNFPIAIPNKNGEVKYMTIPVSWGVKPMKVMADQFYQVGTGKQKNAVDAAKKIALSAIDAYNPAGGTTLQSTLAPTVIDMPLDILTNTSWSGNLVKPDWMTGLPQADQHFKSLEDSSTGKFLIGATGKLSEATDREIDVSPQDANYVLNNMIGGGGKFVKRVFNSVSGLASGEGTDAKNIPFLNRFYKSLDKENIEKGKVRRTREDAMDSFKKFKTGSEEQKKAIQEYVMSVPEGEERTRELMIIGDDTGLDLKGVTSSDAVYRMRPVTDELAKLRAEGKEKEAEDIINGLTRDDYTTLKGIESRAFKEKEGMSKTESIKKQYATDTKELSLPEKAKMIYKKIQVGEEVESEYKSAFYDEAFEELTGKDKPDWFKYLYNKDASFKAAMKNRSKNKTLSNTEKDLKSMGISSNERANFIHDKIQGMEAKEKSAYLDDLKEKKILTSAVYKQLIKLKNK